MQGASADPRPANGGSRKALIFAWGVEGVAVVMGLVLAVFAGIEGSDSGPAAIVIAVLPFAALSIVELTKIPLIELAFRTRPFIWKLMAVVALALVTTATFENFVFGFERGFNERIRVVELAEQAVQSQHSAQDITRTAIPQLTSRQDEITARLAVIRDEVAGIRSQAQEDITDARGAGTATDYRAERERIDRDLQANDQRRDQLLAQERRRCAPQGVPCLINPILATHRRRADELNARLTEINTRQRQAEQNQDQTVSTARERRDADLGARDRERATLQNELNDIRDRLAAAHRTNLQGSEGVAAAIHHRDELIEKSQLHRLSMVLWGSYDRENLELTKRLFVMSLAAIVALIGSIVATMHYAAQSPGRPYHPLRNAIRGYLARRRRVLPLRVDMAEDRRQRFRMMRAMRAYYLRRRRPLTITREIIREMPIDRLKIVFVPLDATEQEVEAARREAAASMPPPPPAPAATPVASVTPITAANAEAAA
ncbi:MAG TPA: hypothetical protein VGM87_15170 [Roseomonas sp.]|jgi:hypothetical protein